jgi:predicted  nucleic acid-binding Zn-ribbon protein
MDSTEKQISSLIREVDELKEYINALEDENASLWFMIEELQKSQTSIGDAVQRMLRERLEEEYYKSLKPVGDA